MSNEDSTQAYPNSDANLPSVPGEALQYQRRAAALRTGDFVAFPFQYVDKIFQRGFFVFDDQQLSFVLHGVQLLHQFMLVIQ